MESPMVSLAVVAYKAAAHLGALLDDIAAQTYPRDRMELLLIDSDSSDASDADGTRALMEAFREEAAGWAPPLAVRVLENPGRILTCGCNVALDAYRGDALVRVDAHASIPPGFIEASVNALLAGHDIVGGHVATAPPRTGREAPLVALDTSRFAGGVAAFRNEGEAREVDALAYPLVRRQVYERVGRFDERLVRTEDNDMFGRMRQAGYRLWYDPAIASLRCTRGTLLGQLRQKWGNGYWVGRSLRVQPRGISLRHLTPALFVLALLCLGAAAALGWPWPLACLAGLYAACSVVFAFREAWFAPLGGKLRCLLFLPFLFFGVHLCYGVGTLVGLTGARRVARSDKGGR